MEKAPTIGKITIDPQVLETITRLTTLAVPGVIKTTPPVGLQRLMGMKDGIQITIHEERVEITLHIVAESNQNMLALSRQIQFEVTRAIQDMVGMEVKAVNVNIEDIVPSLEETEPAG